MPDSPHYQTIAVASTFSPRFLQVLAEAKRIRDRFGSDLSLVYVGDQTEETAERFRGVLRELGLPADSPIYYEQGNPADGILAAIRKNPIDLIIAGALEKEVVFHPFLGNVARRLMREATCSVMLFVRPETEPKPLHRIVFVADEDYSEQARTALRKVYHLAEAETVDKLFVVRIITTFDEARASRESENGGDESSLSGDQEAALEQFVLGAGHTDVPVEIRCIRGNTGFAAADFVQSIEADLLVVPVPRCTEGSSALPPNLAWLTDVIPCNLWVIR